MTDARQTHDTDAGTDPRYHAAFQRGYDGPAPERGAKAEERFRRPRRRDAAATRLRTTALPTSEPVLDPIRALGFEPPAERTATAPEPLPSLPQDDLDERPTEPEEKPWSALDKRVPLALAVLGAVLVLLGSFAMVANVGYGVTGVQTQADQFRSYVFQLLSAPAVTVGLVTVGAAIAVKAVRS
ncbi:hypothetical protein [Rathayibacter sp. Leaf296]|uniref:hypothetical protein n=1 Tax=Rathayibacter sp. Leaf296 TaxID=1736327 RepID=UPI00070310F1|nr:hypothetical protein [Rathayibacter sp. Leaf296]KQQ08470.1 hypothetical protein ASF46_14300 [Rathayibacter sp. Leaf296]